MRLALAATSAFKPSVPNGQGNKNATAIFAVMTPLRRAVMTHCRQDGRTVSGGVSLIDNAETDFRTVRISRLRNF
jgi:hypothetical protein